MIIYMPFMYLIFRLHLPTMYRNFMLFQNALHVLCQHFSEKFSFLLLISLCGTGDWSVSIGIFCVFTSVALKRKLIIFCFITGREFVTCWQLNGLKFYVTHKCIEFELVLVIAINVTAVSRDDLCQADSWCRILILWSKLRVSKRRQGLFLTMASYAVMSIGCLQNYLGIFCFPTVLLRCGMFVVHLTSILYNKAWLSQQFLKLYFLYISGFMLNTGFV